MADKRSEDLLAEVIDRYLGSGDFNGLFIRGADQRGAAAEALIGQGAVEVIGEEDFPNPHIRPWKNRRSGDEQIASLRAAVAGETYGICLYPTSPALADMEEVRVLADRPYTQRLAAGAGQLDVAFFRTDVLESYRNDPRFTFRFNDVGARASISDEVYEDKTQPAADKVSVQRVVRERVRHTTTTGDRAARRFWLGPPAIAEGVRRLHPDARQAPLRQHAPCRF